MIVKNIRAFTLMELLVVILIIGILAAVALPQYQKAVFKARATEAVLMASTVQKAVDAYILEHGWGTEFKELTDNDLDILIPSSSCFGKPSVTYEYSNATEYYYSFSISGADNNVTCGKDLWLILDRDPDGWTKTCHYHEGPAESFCRKLEKQGWTFGMDNW